MGKVGSFAQKSGSWTVYGKWILAGEHAVLRGCPALVFPVKSKYLNLTFSPGERELDIVHSGAHGEELRLLFLGVLERALGRIDRRLGDLRGQFLIENQIPLGAGLGASAAICVATGRWLEGQGLVANEELPEFCRQLENLFHGESSGVDIAVALSGSPIKYYRGEEPIRIYPNWMPNWYLSFCGQRGITAECVARVKSLLVKNAVLGRMLDEQMRVAVESATSALNKTEPEGFSQLCEAMDLANDCFHQWGLADGPMGAHLKVLLKSGAKAVKPTGSGGGGFALSLWQEKPPWNIDGIELIPISGI